ncbi:unnamed protein product [Merluccius merluccius]
MLSWPSLTWGTDCQSFEIPMENPQAEILIKLGLEAFSSTPLDRASMFDINCWNKENKAPLMPKYLPRAFLQRLWLLSPDARSPRCMTPCDDVSESQAEDNMINGQDQSHCTVNPLDLLTVETLMKIFSLYLWCSPICGVTQQHMLNASDSCAVPRQLYRGKNIFSELDEAEALGNANKTEYYSSGFLKLGIGSFISWS